MKKNKLKATFFLYIISTIIPIIVTIIGLLAGNFAPWGTKNVLSAGDFSDYLPYYLELYDRVHSGQSLTFSNNLNLGYDFSSVITFFLSDPTNFIILLFPRTAIISVINILYALKIGFAGLSMSIFLNYIANKNEYNTNDNSDSSDEPDKDSKNFMIGLKREPKTDIGKLYKNTDWINIAFSISYALSTPLAINAAKTSFNPSLSNSAPTLIVSNFKPLK